MISVILIKRKVCAIKFSEMQIILCVLLIEAFSGKT